MGCASSKVGWKCKKRTQPIGCALSGMLLSLDLHYLHEIAVPRGVLDLPRSVSQTHLPTIFSISCNISSVISVERGESGAVPCSPFSSMSAMRRFMASISRT